MYLELHSRSAFSFLEAASLPEALAGWCAELGMPAMALLDRDGIYGAPRFHLAGQKAGVKAHIGSEVTVRADEVSRFAFRVSRSHSERKILPKCGTAELPNYAATENQFGSSAIRQFGNDFEPRCAPCELGRAQRALAIHDGGFARESRNANCESQTWNLETSKLDFFRLPLLVRERSGYQNLCRLITRMKLRAPKYPLESHPETIAATTAEELAEFSRGLICLTGG